VAWVLGEPQVFLITAGDITLLPKMLKATERFSERPSDADMQGLVEEFGIQPVFT